MKPVWLMFLVLAGVLSVSAGPESPSGDATWNPSDETVREVLRMYKEGVADSVILTWLDQAQPPIRQLEPNDLVGLTRAGVSERVINLLIRRAAAATQAAKTVSPPADAKVAVRFDLDYSPVVREGEEPWDLFFYLNGELLAWCPGAQNPLNRKSLVFIRALAPGSYLVRLNRERHIPRSSDKWRHETRICPATIPLTITPGSEIEVKVVFAESTFFWKPPLSYTIHRGGETLASERGLGGQPESWPRLCEDLEANQKAGKTDREVKPPAADCTRWSSLWEGIQVPDRRAVLEEMAHYKFRPVPVTSR